MTFPILPSNSTSGADIYGRSLRFNSADSAYLNRTPSVAGNRKTWTWSGWVKLCASNPSYLFSNLDSSGLNGFGFQFMGSNAFDIFDYSTSYVWRLNTNQVFRDFSAWYHVVLVFDSTQATSSNRVRLYVNGVEITSFSASTYPTQNYDGLWNSTSAASVGRGGAYAGAYINSYLTEVNFIDGQALDPSYFGATNATTGQWQPKAYSGSYGTNGFYLNFKNNSTVSALGTDYSGNGNNWTPNNFSVTAGAGNDSMWDYPANVDDGGNGRGNYCTLNPLDKITTATLSNGNLEFITSTSGNSAVTTFGITSGKWYWEAQTSAGSTEARAGVYGTSASALYSFAANNTVYGFRFDAGTGALDYTTNGSSWTSLATGLTSGPYFVYLNNNGTTSKTITANFGQRPFAYTPPSGFKALNTQNIAAGTITTSGSFTGNVNADGPFVWLNGVPTAMTINGNAVTFGTHADKLANGFKVRTSSTSYNNTGSNTYSITTTGAKFKNANAQGNP